MPDGWMSQKMVNPEGDLKSDPILALPLNLTKPWLQSGPITNLLLKLNPLLRQNEQGLMEKGKGKEGKANRNEQWGNT